MSDTNDAVGIKSVDANSVSLVEAVEATADSLCQASARTVC